MILRDLKSLWVTVRRFHFSSFQGKGHSKNTCMKNCERVEACGSDHGQNHSFRDCVKDRWFRKINGRHRAIQENNVFDRLESF